MEQALLRKVQLTQLEIAKEIKRVCEENDISYFLCCGSFLGAVRHKGFIPWDDDLDIGMLRQDYEKFARIAPEKLGAEYCFQDWNTDPRYALPFGKVRKRNTLYVERKSIRLPENGIYVDVFPFDYAPVTAGEQRAYTHRLVSLFRTKMMKSKMRPWMENDKVLWKKRIGYLYYQMKALFTTHQTLIQKYEKIATSAPCGSVLCRQRGWSHLDCYETAWCTELDMYSFEGELFPGPKDYDGFLRSIYGDYTQIPPEGTRENRHQIIMVNLGDGNGDWIER